MKLHKKDDRWWTESTYNERLIPKDAGFEWNNAKMLGVWSTDRFDRALRLRAYADEEVLQEFGEKAQEGIRRIDASRASLPQEDGAVIPVPEGKQYMPFQVAGIQYALGHSSVLFGDDMGLGKTVQAIGVMNACKVLGRVLIVCPSTLRVHWRQMVKAWSVRDLAVGTATSDSFPSTQVVIIHYDILWKHREAIRRVVWGMTVVDEAHMAKNPQALRTQALMGKWASDPTKRLDPIKSVRKLALTGTPIPNRPIEVHTILNWLQPNEWGSRLEFGKRYCGAKQTRFGWDMNGSDNLEELQLRMRMKVMVRRLKRDVLTELPPKIRQVIELPAPPALKAELEEELNGFLALEADLAKLNRLVQEAKRLGNQDEYRGAVEELRESERVIFSKMAKQRHRAAQAKLPYVMEAIREALEGGGKLVVMAHHKDIVKAIYDAFRSMAVVLDGDTPNEDRQAAVDRFQTDENVRLFVGSIMVAGTGITLTAASHMIFAELDWVPGNITQCEDRESRIGQVESVLIQHFVLEGSLDAYMARRLVEKQEVMDKALDRTAGNNSVRSVTQAAETITDAPRMVTNVVPVAETCTAGKQTAVSKATGVSDAQRAIIHRGLRILAGICDGARKRDDVGFNAYDTEFGRKLANQQEISYGQAMAARKMLKKYHRQLGQEMLADMGIVL